MRYDHPNFVIRREFPTVTTAGAAAVGARFASFQKIRVKAVHAIALVAGTSTNNSLVVRNGTNVLTTLAMGTSTVGSHISNTVNEIVDAFGFMSVTNGSDAVGVSAIIYEYEVRVDSAVTP
jgi:hypothetical protein